MKAQQGLNFKIASPSAQFKCSLPKTVRCIPTFGGGGEIWGDPIVSSHPP